MPLVDNAHYVDSAGWSAMTAWAANTAISAGALRRQNAAPSVGNERAFVCVVAGTTHLTTEPTWTVTRGAKTTDNTVTWQECTGLAGVNGDVTNTPTWTTVKNTAIVLGQIIKRDNAASYQICTTAGTAGNGSEPSFSDTAGTTTADNTVTWTSLGVVGNFTGNQAPAARLSLSLTTNWGQAGNTIYVKSSHAETQATTNTLAGVGTLASPIKVVCHGGAAYPPTSTTTGASITASGNTTAITITGNLYVEGISFVHSGTGSNIALVSGTTAILQRFKNCGFSITANSTTCDIRAGAISVPASGQSRLFTENCTMTFGNASQVVGMLQCRWTWTNAPSAIAGTLPTTLFTNGGSSTTGTVLDLYGVDLSALGAGKTLVGNGVGMSGTIRMVNCKLNASVTVAAAATKPSMLVNLVNCDSGANYRNERYAYEGTLTTEITIVHTGGASDGTTLVAWKVVTTANASFANPFECPPIALWNETTGSPVTLTLDGIWGGGAVPNDDEIWVEVEYLGTSSSPLSSFVSDAKASIPATAAGQDAGTGTWGGSTTKFALAVTFTPQTKGEIIARVKCGKASSTFYIDPKPVLS